MGTDVGVLVGVLVGAWVGVLVGAWVGAWVGWVDVGFLDGIAVGTTMFRAVGVHATMFRDSSYAACVVFHPH